MKALTTSLLFSLLFSIAINAQTTLVLRTGDSLSVVIHKTHKNYIKYKLKDSRDKTKKTVYNDRIWEVIYSDGSILSYHAPNEKPPWLATRYLRLSKGNKAHRFNVGSNIQYRTTTDRTMRKGRITDIHSSSIEVDGHSIPLSKIKTIKGKASNHKGRRGVGWFFLILGLILGLGAVAGAASGDPGGAIIGILFIAPGALLFLLIGIPILTSGGKKTYELNKKWKPTIREIAPKNTTKKPDTYQWQDAA